MSQAITCPKCHRQVSEPATAEADAWVRCPLCKAKYALHEALAYMPPMLEIVPASSATGEAATMDMLSWQAHQGGEHGLPPTAHEPEGGEGTELPPMADDWFAPGDDAQPDEAVPEEAFAMAGMVDRPAAHLPSAASKADQPTLAPKKRRRAQSEGSAFGKLIAAVIGLFLAVIIVVPATWWILKKDVTGLVGQKWFPSFLGFAMPQEVKDKMYKEPRQVDTNNNSSAPAPSNHVANNNAAPVTDPSDNPDANAPNPAMPAKPGINDVAGNNLPNKDANPLDEPKNPATDPAFDLTPKPDLKPDLTLEPPPAFDLNPDAKPQPKPDAKPDPVADAKPEPELFPDAKPAPKSEPKPETKPEAKLATLKNAPVYTAADLNAALQAADDAAKMYATARLDPAQEKTARRTFLLALYALAEKATLAAEDPAATQHKESIPRAILQGGNAAGYVDTIGAGAAIWIPHPTRKPTDLGIALAGTVTQMQKRGELFVAKVALAGKFADDKPGEYLVVSPQPLPNVAESTPALILGVIVDKPAEMIDGFTGDEPRVIWSNYALAVQK